MKGKTRNAGKAKRRSARIFAKDDLVTVTMAAVEKKSASNGAALHAHFNKEGYVHIQPLLPEAELANLRENLERVVNDVLPRIPETQKYFDVKDDPNSLKQIQMLHEHDPYFAALAGTGGIQHLAETLLGEPASLVNIQYFNKPPKTAKPTPAHQDGYYFHIKPNRAVTMWLAIDPADQSNGCLSYVKGSSAEPIRPHQPSGVLGFSQKCTDYGTKQDLKNLMVMKAKPGDIVCHDSRMLHMAGPNITPSRQRRAVGFIYYASSVVHDDEKAAAYQKTINDALKKKGLI